MSSSTTKLFYSVWLCCYKVFIKSYSVPEVHRDSAVPHVCRNKEPSNWMVQRFCCVWGRPIGLDMMTCHAPHPGDCTPTEGPTANKGIACSICINQTASHYLLPLHMLFERLPFLRMHLFMCSLSIIPLIDLVYRSLRTVQSIVSWK